MSEKSLMKLAADLGVSFSAAKIISDHAREEYDAKITKADQLCEAAKGVIGSYPEDEEQYWHTWEKFKKAIAEYGGNA